MAGRGVWMATVAAGLSIAAPAGWATADSAGIDEAPASSSATAAVAAAGDGPSQVKGERTARRGAVAGRARVTGSGTDTATKTATGAGAGSEPEAARSARADRVGSRVVSVAGPFQQREVAARPGAEVRGDRQDYRAAAEPDLTVQPLPSGVRPDAPAGVRDTAPRLQLVHWSCWLCDIADGPPAAPVAAAVESLNTAVVGFFDAAARVASGLPSPLAEVVSGALLLLRRGLFDQAPVVAAGEQFTSSAGVVGGFVLGADPERDPLTYEVSTAPVSGTVEIGSDGTYTYTPNSGFSGSDGFTVTVADANGGFNLLDAFGSRTRNLAVVVTVPPEIDAGQIGDILPETFPRRLDVINTWTLNWPLGIAAGTRIAGTDDYHTRVLVTSPYASTKLPDQAQANSVLTIWGPTFWAEGVGLTPVDVAWKPSLNMQAYVVNAGDGTLSVIARSKLFADTLGSEPPRVSTVKVGSLPSRIAVAANGLRAYVTNLGDNSVSVIDLATDSVTATISGLDAPDSITVSPDGRFAYAAVTGGVAVIDTATNTATTTIPVSAGERPAGITINSDGTRLYVTNAKAGTVSAIDTVYQTVTGSPIPVGKNPAGIAFRDNLVYVANRDPYKDYTFIGSGLSVIDATTNKVVAYQSFPDEGYSRVAISPLGEIYVTNPYSNSLKELRLR